MIGMAEKRRPGRPPNVPGEVREKFSVRLRPVIVALLREIAAEGDITASALTERALIREFRRMKRIQ